MNRCHFGIATLLGLTLALIVTLLLLPQAALGKDSASGLQTDAPPLDSHYEGAGRVASPLGPTDDLTYTAYLPIVVRTPTGIHGQVTYQGNPVSGIILTLRLWDGSSSFTSPVLTTTTQADGTYWFSGAPSLGANQQYSVRYQNYSEGNADNPHYVGYWVTHGLTSYTAGTNAAGGDFDIADAVLTSPDIGATVALPCTFRWTRRFATPSDNYKVFMIPFGSGLNFLTDPLGYVDSYTLSSLPSGFPAGAMYFWWVDVSDPTGGGGINYLQHWVRFSSSSTGLQYEARQDQLIHALDIERLLELREARGR